MAAIIPAAIPTQSFELIRNRIAEILVQELPAQATFLADTKINATVYVERYVSFDLTELPAVNVSLNRGLYAEQTQKSTDGTYTYNIDCHTSAKSTSAGARGDSLSMFQLQKLLGVCRGILEDTRYNTLGFARPFIESSKITTIDIGNATEGDATSSVMGRLTLVVRANEQKGVVTPELIAGYDTQVKLGLTEKGYIFTGDNIPVPPVTGAEISVNDTFYIDAQAGQDYNIPVIDSAGDEVGTVTPSTNVTIDDSVITLKDTGGNVLDTVNVLATQSEDVIAPDATIEINGALFDTATSGGNLDIPVISEGANPVGSKVGTDYVIGNNATYINSVQVTDQEAEVDSNIAVTLDGVQDGTWNAGTQTWEVVSSPCLDGNIELNGTPVATVPSGGTEDIDVVNGGANPVGSWDGFSWVIGNNYTEINGVQVTDQEAEVNASIAVELDGTPSGVWNAGTQTWEVTSDPCEDAILQRNGTQIKTIASGATFNLLTRLDGAANNGTWNGTDTLDFTSAPCSPVTFQINAVNKESIASGSIFNLITKLDGVVNSGSYDAPTDTLSFTSAVPTPKTTAFPLKSGETVSYGVGSDGNIGSGRGTSWLVMAENNMFGNTNRFTDTLGGQTYANNIVLDHQSRSPLTGNLIGYDRADVITARTFAAHLTYFAAKVNSGYSGWRGTNYQELHQISRWGGVNFKWSNAPFSYTGAGTGDYLWTTTTNNIVTTDAWLVFNYSTVPVQGRDKGGSYFMMGCRTFTLTDAGVLS